MDTFGKRLRRLRDKKTQQEVASAIKVERSTYTSWETGRREPDYDMAVRLADYFGVSVDFLLGRPLEIHESSARYYIAGNKKYNLDELMGENGEVIINGRKFTKKQLDQFMERALAIEEALAKTKWKPGEG